MSIRVHAIVHGTVQGVGFRWAVEQGARDAGIGGFVRNRPDGTLEAALEGDEAAVERVLHLLRTGPPAAHVTHVDVEQVPLRDQRSFSAR